MYMCMCVCVCVFIICINVYIYISVYVLRKQGLRVEDWCIQIICGGKNIVSTRILYEFRCS